jgi:hypothetical protein
MYLFYLWVNRNVLKKIILFWIQVNTISFFFKALNAHVVIQKPVEQKLNLALHLVIEHFETFEKTRFRKISTADSSVLYRGF